MRKLAAFFLIVVFCLFTFIAPVHADEISDLQNQIDNLQHALDLSKNATTPLESQVTDLQAQFASIQAKISQLQKQLQQSEDDLEFQKKVMAATVRKFYIDSFTDIPLLTILSSGDATDTLKLIAYQQESSTQDKQTISNIGQQIAKIADDKTRLASASDQINKQSQFLKGQIASAKSYQSQLEGQIAALTAQQQAIINAKSGTFTTSVGDVPLADDPNAAPSFNPGFSPAFAGFSFGAYSHRNGMSQYGAKARSDGGQNFRDILSHYYSGDQIKQGYSEPSINVDGYGSMSTDKYLDGIAEMPSTWSADALKAQVIAARSYALSYTNNGSKSI